MAKASTSMARGVVTPGYSLDGVRRSAFERTMSILLALLVLLGLTVAILLVVWLTMRIFARQTAVPVTLQEIGTGDSEGAPGGGSAEDLEPPPPEEMMNLEPPVENPLSVVQSVVAAESMLADPLWDDRPRTGKGTGKGTGVGGAEGPGRGGRPRRWEIEFPRGNTLKSYARQLDFFGIELGILQPDGKVVYAFNFSKDKPDTRTGPAEAEKRYYLTWRRGRDQLVQADRELLALAGIPAEGKIILKFIPPKLELHLLTLEKQRADSRGQTRVQRTVFRVQPQGAGFDFAVIDQIYE